MWRKDPNLGKAVYWYNSDITPQTLEDSAQNLMEQSKLIAVVRYQGEQDYTNQTFLTKAEVVSVYQGDASLEGDHILIYEPVRLYYSPAHEWLHDAEVYQFIGKIPGAEADDRFVNGFPKTEPMCYHAPMQEGREYLVFLTPKEYPKESPLYQQEEEYNYVESIYALLDLSAQPENFMPAPELILLEEAAEYPVLLMNEAELERYIRNREEITIPFLVTAIRNKSAGILYFGEARIIKTGLVIPFAGGKACFYPVYILIVAKIHFWPRLIYNIHIQKISLVFF